MIIIGFLFYTFSVSIINVTAICTKVRWPYHVLILMQLDVITEEGWFEELYEFREEHEE